MANVTVPRAYTCTPSSLLNSAPCLSCLSEKQMLATLLAIITIYNEDEVRTVLEDSACLMCMSKKQMLQALVTIMGNNLLGETYSASDIADRVKCLECASQKQIMAAILHGSCNVLRFSMAEPQT